jgi:TonB family protein
MEPLTDGIAEVEAHMEQLPALAFVSVGGMASPSDEFSEPARGLGTRAADATLLPPNLAAARARERYRQLISDAARAAGALVEAVARRGERNGRDAGDTGVGAQDASARPPSGPTRGPLPAAENRPPNYPEELRRSNCEGTAWIHAVIEADGSVSSARIARSAGHDALDASALAAVLAWRFDPALEDGVAVRSEAEFPVVFRMKPRRAG